MGISIKLSNGRCVGLNIVAELHFDINNPNNPDQNYIVGGQNKLNELQADGRIVQGVPFGDSGDSFGLQFDTSET